MEQFSGKLLLVLGTLLSQGVRIGAGMVLARYVAKEEQGKYVLVASFAGLF